MTDTDPDEFARAAAVDFARRLVRNSQEAFGTELLGAYLIGSLAHAGFSRRYSDVDMALVTTAGLSPQTLDRMRNEAVALSADWGPKLSVFWSDRHFSLGRFPPLDRVDYLDHAIALMERERVCATRGVDAAAVEAAFTTRMAELAGDGTAEVPLPSPPAPIHSDAIPEETAEMPGRVALWAALRGSVDRGTAAEAARPSETPAAVAKSTRKRRLRGHMPSTPPVPAGVDGQPTAAALGPERVSDAASWHIEKSTLTLSEPRRYRDRAHLKFVSSQPCLLCGRRPSDAHHLRFAQPRALGRRVSDEFAVPLCRTHHRVLHTRGDEAAWWESVKLDPVTVARELWERTRLNDASTSGRDLNKMP